jgi:hypothetical protein
LIPAVWSPRRALLSLAAILGPLAIAWAALSGPAAGQAPNPQELQQLLSGADAMLARIAALRGLEPPAALHKVIRPRDAIARRYLELVRERYPAARLEAERKVLAKFALIPADFPLERFLMDMAGEQVAAYFDHVKGEMVLADWLPAAMQAPVLTHELVHALQHQHVDLRKFLDLRPGQSDFLLARHAILEGEATAVMLDLLVQPVGLDVTRLPDLTGLTGQISGATSPVLARAPKFLREQLLFPYTTGTAFVVAFRRRQAWPAFTRLYGDPPRSSEQILHPAKYFDRRDAPQTVLLPDVRGILGPGWSLALEDDAGEFGVRGILERFLPEAEARGAAEGWGGDRFHLYERAADGQQALVFLTAWDSEADAREFAGAYARLIPAKYPRARAGAGGAGAPRRGWTRGDEALAVERRGGDVLILEGVPRRQEARVREWVWRLRGAQR